MAHLDQTIETIAQPELPENAAQDLVVEDLDQFTQSWCECGFHSALGAQNAKRNDFHETNTPAIMT